MNSLTQPPLDPTGGIPVAEPEWVVSYRMNPTYNGSIEGAWHACPPSSSIEDATWRARELERGDALRQTKIEAVR